MPLLACIGAYVRRCISRRRVHVRGNKETGTPGASIPASYKHRSRHVSAECGEEVWARWFLGMQWVWLVGSSPYDQPRAPLAGERGACKSGRWCIRKLVLATAPSPTILFPSPIRPPTSCIPYTNPPSHWHLSNMAQALSAALSLFRPLLHTRCSNHIHVVALPQRQTSMASSSSN